MEILAFLYFLLFHDWGKTMQEGLKESREGKDEEVEHEDRPVDYRRHPNDGSGD